MGDHEAASLDNGDRFTLRYFRLLDIYTFITDCVIYAVGSKTVEVYIGRNIMTILRLLETLHCKTIVQFEIEKIRYEFQSKHTVREKCLCSSTTRYRKFRFSHL